jgi:hypothetical protein
MLSDDSLRIRVMAYENLRRITGKTFFYRPENTESRRRSSVQDWRTELEEGNIQYEEAPAPTIYGG